MPLSRNLGTLTHLDPSGPAWPVTGVLYLTYGIAESRFVSTVAPQNGICPQGSTYPMNAVAMVKNRITTPTDHVCMKL